MRAELRVRPVPGYSLSSDTSPLNRRQGRLWRAFAMQGRLMEAFRQLPVLGIDDGPGAARHRVQIGLKMLALNQKFR